MSNKIRCAVYTRKSTDEGLDQEFNSLDAQREACEAYILSQRGEGWAVIPKRYDDGGISGGTMERPALQALMADIERGKIDLVVVYKVDRLTRSLADFSKIVDVFDGHQVSFVSVTQQFNTATSMGRLTLNMLLSFAQFEREVTAERIRDKIAASKQKGMWMGGQPPLGYDAVDKKLVVNEAEAKTVRLLFDKYLELGSVRRLKAAADSLGLVTKRRVAENRTTGGKPISRGNLYQILRNPIYAGLIGHKGQTYEGQHKAIVDKGVWKKAQELLDGNAAPRRSTYNVTSRHQLIGRVFDENGNPLCPTHTVKKGRRYLYYVSKHLLHSSGGDDTGWRLSAKELEQAVANILCTFLEDENSLLSALEEQTVSASDAKALTKQASALGAQLNGPDGRSVLPGLVTRVDVSPGTVQIAINGSTLLEDPRTTNVDEATPAGDVIRVSAPMKLRRRGVESKLVLAAPGGSIPDEKLISLIARSHGWLEKLTSGSAKTVKDLAAADQLDPGDVSRFLPLAFLAPDIAEAILNGRQPVELTVEELRRRCPLPLDWADQRKRLHFAN